MPKFSRSIEEAIVVFEQKFEPEPNTGCYIWKAGIDKDGYGKVRWQKKDWRAHRLSLFFYKNQIIDNKSVVRHLCNQPLCVNPDHLTFGNVRDNINDMIKARRRIGNRKYSLDDYHQVLKLFNEGFSRYDISEVTGLSRTTVTRYVSNGYCSCDGCSYYPKAQQKESKISTSGYKFDYKLKLNQAQVDEIRQRYSTGKYLQKDLAKDFNITPSTIGLIVRGKNWK